jgi:hypothetical protein
MALVVVGLNLRADAASVAVELEDCSSVGESSIVDVDAVNPGMSLSLE